MALLHRIILSAIFGYAISRVVIWTDRAWNEESEIRTTVDVLVNGLRPPRRSRPRKP